MEAEGDGAKARALAPYTLSAMSDDALALLSALGVERAHVVGASMGGMIAQTMAIEHPQRVLTLTSIELAYASLRSPEAIVESVAAAIQAALKKTDAHICHAAGTACR